MRKTIIILLSCTILLLLGYCGYRAYGLWKQSHWMALARQYAEKKDARNEFLCLKQALVVNPRNVEACRMMANLAAATGSPATLTWREKVVELDPASLNDRLALVQTAIILSDYNAATNALADADPADKTTPNYLDVAGELATAENKPDEAEADFAEAARLDPSNPVSQFSLAFLQLHGTNPLDMAEARINLKRLSMNCTNLLVRSQAERQLVYDAMRFKDYNSALSFSKELVQQPNAVFPDKLLRLDILRTAKNDEYNSALAACQRQAASDTNRLTEMTFWLIARNLTPDALAWLQSLPPNIQTNPPAAVLAVQCQIRLKDWQAVQDAASHENWGNMEFMRHAYLALALRQQGFYQPSKAEWELAARAATGQLNKMTALIRFAAQWNWQDETQQMLWDIVEGFPAEKWAEQLLEQVLYQNGSTRSLMQLLSMKVTRNPSDLQAKNDLALVAMLLHAQELNPYDLAHEVYQKDPTNSFYQCTYGFALHLQGKNADALKVMQQLSPQALQNNSTAGYYGVVLNAAGDKSQAGIYLKRSVRGQLLPEERALFQQAMTGP
jgi:lipopolysaccharide biosynthesis regulator YciM